MQSVLPISWVVVLIAIRGDVAQAMQGRAMLDHELNGILYTQIDQLAAKEGMQLHDEVVLSSRWQTVRLEPDSRRAWLNGEIVWLHEPVRRIRRQWAVARVDVETLLAPLFRPSEHLMNLHVGTIVLDPGHGGKDRGSEGQRPSVEKQLSLDVCRRIRKLLINDSVSVQLTRVDDRFLELSQRSIIAKDMGGDLFVSVHFNSAGNTNASGVEVYALTAATCRSTSDNGGRKPDTRTYAGHRYNASNALLAKHIHHQLLKATRANDRGLRRARFAVLREAPCPAILVECGFLSNAAEEDRILSSFYRQRVAEGIAAGIRDYIHAVNLARASVLSHK